MDYLRHSRSQRLLNNLRFLTIGRAKGLIDFGSQRSGPLPDGGSAVDDLRLDFLYPKDIY